MNSVCLIGRLTRNPKLHKTQTGKSVASFSLAVDRRVRPESDGPKADFIPVIAWNKLADVAVNHLEKGRRVLVEGRIQTRSYTAQDETVRRVVEVVALGIEFLDAPKKPDNWDNGIPGRSVSSEEIPF